MSKPVLLHIRLRISGASASSPDSQSESYFDYNENTNERQKVKKQPRMVEGRSIVPCMRFFVEEGSNLKPGRLDDATYALAQSSFPVFGLDIMPYSRKESKVYLGWRIAKPMQDEWWTIGGRIRFGQTEAEGARSIFKRETGQDLNTNRLEYFAMIHSFMKNREQEPNDIGSHSISLNFGIEVTTEEIETISAGLDPKEYQGKGMRAFSLPELEGEVQPIVFEMAQWCLRPRK